MKIDITGKGVELTDALREHAAGRVAKAFGHVLERPARCHVIISHVRHSHRAEIVVNHQGRSFAAAATAPADMYAAIDGAADKLQRQLADTAERERERSRPSASSHE